MVTLPSKQEVYNNIINKNNNITRLNEFDYFGAVPHPNDQWFHLVETPNYDIQIFSDDEVWVEMAGKIHLETQQYFFNTEEMKQIRQVLGEY